MLTLPAISISACKLPSQDLFQESQLASHAGARPAQRHCARPASHWLWRSLRDRLPGHEVQLSLANSAFGNEFDPHPPLPYMRCASHLRGSELQERGLRSGTVPAPLAIGFGAACEIASQEMDYDTRHIRSLADRLYNNITQQVHPRIPLASVCRSCGLHQASEI